MTVEIVSVWFAGTGVNTGVVPLESFRSSFCPSVNVLGAGQVVPAGSW